MNAFTVEMDKEDTGETEEGFGEADGKENGERTGGVGLGTEGRVRKMSDKEDHIAWWDIGLYGRLGNLAIIKIGKWIYGYAPLHRPLLSMLSVHHPLSRDQS